MTKSLTLSFIICQFTTQILILNGKNSLSCAIAKDQTNRSKIQADQPANEHSKTPRKICQRLRRKKGEIARVIILILGKS